MDEVEILSIEIETKFRNMGLGLILFNEIERSFEERKISKCFLEVNINNDLARNFYEKLGFICIKNIKNYYKSDNSYQDGLLLQKTYI
jgi:ribosomal protein S18 acetylase RimI-like enzyme